MGSMYKLWCLANYLYRHHIPILPGLIMKINRIIFSCEIPYTVRLGKNIVFAHNGLGVVINEEATIGDNCKIMQNVTIGGRGNHGVPTIGNNVLIGCSAAILGGVTIGDDAKIGANAVVIGDIPRGRVAVGVPAKIK